MFIHERILMEKCRRTPPEEVTALDSEAAPADAPVLSVTDSCALLQVLVLSTRLLRPTDIPELLFATQRLAPDIGV